MRPIYTALCAAALMSTAAHAANVSVQDSTGPWLGFMSVFELPANGGGFVFGSPWEPADLATSFDDGAGTMTFGVNSIDDPDPFWYQGGGGPGALGNKFMEANMFIQVDDDSLAGQTVTFEGNIDSLSFTSAHESFIFIRDFAADFSSFNETAIAVTEGAFSISLDTDAGLGRHVQYGFQVRGENVWSTDVSAFGNMVISTVPAPTSLAMLGMGGLMVTRRRRSH